MNGNKYAVLTVKGWDGSRILGLFTSTEEARKVRDTFLKRSAPLKNELQEEFYIDVVELGKLSSACEIFMNSKETTANTTTRKHIYV